MFKAIHNVSIGLKLYKRGEEIPTVPEEMQERLMKLGAIEKIAPFPVPESIQQDDAPIPEGADADDAQDDDEGEGAEETPEIDLMDGIVSDEAPAKRRRASK